MDETKAAVYVLLVCLTWSDLSGVNLGRSKITVRVLAFDADTAKAAGLEFARRSAAAQIPESSGLRFAVEFSSDAMRFGAVDCIAASVVGGK